MEKEELLKEMRKIDYRISEAAIEIRKNFFLEFDDRNLKHRDLDFGGKTKEEWIENIEKTLDILEKKAPKSFSKIKGFLKIIVPYGYEKGIQKSLSYTDQIRIIYISYQDSPLIQAEAIIHETNHTILFLFSKLDQGLVNSYEPLYYSAVQDKPRELHNCFLAYHAFVHVLEFYVEFISNTKQEEELVSTVFPTYLKTTSLQNVIEKYSKFTKEGKKLFLELKKLTKLCEKEINSLKKKYKKDFEEAQEGQISHF